MHKYALLLLPLAAASFLTSCAGGLRLLNPAIHHVRRIPMPPVRLKVEKLISDRLKAGDVTEAAVYFHSLRTGYWFGINEQEKFIPASLLKIYIMIRVLLEEEEAPGTLRKRLELKREPLYVPQEVDRQKRLQEGRQYSVDELLGHMIDNSDNDAAYTLTSAFGDLKLARIYADFGFDINTQDEASLSLKQYLTTFLTLYNSTYLGTRMSEKALEYLVQASFKEGLEAGLPPGTVLANKFGERGVDTPQGRRQQIHDCGIIYHHDYPYILGVMTRGSDINKQTALIKDISALIWSEVDYRSNEAQR